MTQEKAKELSNTLIHEMEELAGKHGLTFIREGKVTFDEQKLWFKVIFSEAEKIEVERKKFEQNCWKYGLTATDFLRAFVDGSGNIHKIVGINTKASKYPILTERISDGKCFKFNGIAVMALLNKAVIPGGQNVRDESSKVF